MVLQDKSIRRRQGIQQQIRIISLQRKLQSAIQSPFKNSFSVSKIRSFEKSLHMFDTHENESTNNAIAYVAPKNKAMSHSMSLNNRISCIVGISTCGFNKYWQNFFNLMELNMIPTSKMFLKDKKTTLRKNYQLYDVKMMRALHKQEMMKHQRYEKYLRVEVVCITVQE